MTESSTRDIRTDSETNIIQVISVASSPHLKNLSLSSRKMMIDVMIALLPVMGMAIYMFKWLVVKQLIIAVGSTLSAEAVFTKMRRKSFSLPDGSAGVTGLILGLSIPVIAPWYVGVIGSVVAIGIGKVIFGGLGMNIFNPAMVGRAFVMIAFTGVMAAAGYENKHIAVDAISMATPLDAFKQSGFVTPLRDLFFGFTNGSPGEISALACVSGGVYLCLRRTAAWEIPLGVILSASVMGLFSDMIHPDVPFTFLHHLAGGSLLFGAFFIATDPVTSPISKKGRFLFGMGIGFILMMLRFFSGYPEGVMFAVLFMNAVTPLINRWTIPKTLGT
ncbi:MAG: RnfABCDGE type electron transport complex subunit D [Proteobacteria bacterium]|nr:RnfABCDGE type electron transport complex subunit D [Pseudomonadota bacterium]